MTVYIVAYVVALVVFAICDGAWLSYMGPALYTETLKNILAENLRYGPAVAFYLLFPIGVIFFAVRPALQTGSLGTAALYGALFGLFTYGTYELTNFATLKDWTLKIVLIDICYGAVMVALVASLAYLVARNFYQGG